MNELQHFQRTGIIRNPFKLSKNDWNRISHQHINELFILRWKDFLDWRVICEYQTLSEEFMEHLNLKYLYLNCISAHQKLSERFMIKYANVLDWSLLSASQKMSEDFIREHRSLISFSQLHYNSNLDLSINFLREFEDEIRWDEWWVFVPVKYDVLCEFKDKVDDWKMLSKNINLPLEVIEKFRNELDWTEVCLKTHLPEKFIEEHLDYIDWDTISYAQPLSEQFIEKYSDRVNWKHIQDWRVKHFSDDFKQKFSKQIEEI